MILAGISLDPIAKPIAAVLAFFYSLVPNYAAAIILLTIGVMVILTPLTIKQTRSMLAMQKLQPELKKLQEKHKNDRQALNEAVMALYKEHNASPLGGCLPMLLPLPVFFALFRVLEGLSRMVKEPGATVKTSHPKYLKSSTQMFIDIKHAGGHLNSFGMDLAKSATNIGGGFGDKAPYFVLLLIMVGTQFYQQRQMTSRLPASAQGQQQAVMKFIPLIFGVISIRFPAGVVLYWTVSNGIRIFQQWAMYRWDPKVKAMVAKDISEVEATTREIDQAERQPRPRLRDLLSGAANSTSNPVADRGNNRPATNKPGTTPPKARPTDAKGARPPAKGGAGGKGTTSAKPGTGKPGTARPGTAKPGAAKPPANRSGTGKDPATNGTPPPNGNGGDKAAGTDASATGDTPASPTEGNGKGSPRPPRTGGTGARPSSRSKRDRPGR